MEIREFAESDRTELRALAQIAGEGSPTASLWGHPESEAAIYLDPYLDREPESVFVSVEEGKLTGFLVGTVDSAKFPSEEARMTDAIRRYRLGVRRGPALFFARAMADTVAAKLRRHETAGEYDDPDYPAHLHINLAPAARGTGAAEALVHRFLDHARTAGAPGCYLQTLTENTRAVRFFTRVGFTLLGAPTDVPGLRYQGRRVHQQTMVQSL
ncbi:GNAT family N-acetyltransferase [Nocardia mangyaensis]|uniref:GNAT family N-acetyltransferase n=1 Tax=Nocardia mangyaensis TaxID=2213200 RepID=A0A1J0VQ35_9NOCA|nr:GNAT family N-acetyltransferase [Nocardia mangyaensis]APE34147.1 GNAT family N-acetyltransferase [Nocardia mangyaensis]